MGDENIIKYFNLQIEKKEIEEGQNENGLQLGSYSKCILLEWRRQNNIFAHAESDDISRLRLPFGKCLNSARVFYLLKSVFSLFLCD